MSEKRTLSAIAQDIRKHWKDKQGHSNIYFGAKPYLEVMSTLGSIDDQYGLDSGRSIVNYFLCNANSFRGEHARRIKAELKALVK